MRQPDQGEQVRDLGRAGGRGADAVDLQRVGEDVVDGHARVQRRGRVLEDHGHGAAEFLAHGRVALDGGLAAEEHVPEVGACRPTSTEASVDLPQPDSPTMPTVSPRLTVKSTPLTA